MPHLHLRVLRVRLCTHDSHTFTHSHTAARPCICTLTHLTHSLAHTFTRLHPHTHSPTIAHSKPTCTSAHLYTSHIHLTHPLTHTFTLTPAHSYTFLHICTLIHAHTFTFSQLTHIHTYTHSLTHRWCLSQCSHYLFSQLTGPANVFLPQITPLLQTNKRTGLCCRC